MLGETEYPTIFAISSPVSPGIISHIIEEVNLITEHISYIS